MSLVQRFEDVFAGASASHQRATAASDPSTGDARAAAAVAQTLNHQKRVWGLVNALWGQVRLLN